MKTLLVTYRRGDHGTAREGAARTLTRELTPEIFRWQEKRKHVTGGEEQGKAELQLEQLGMCR